MYKHYIGGSFMRVLGCRTWQLVIVLILFVFVLYCAAAESQQQLLAGKLIRLHVVAASDEPEAQELKLKIKDEVLQAVAPLLKGCKSRQQAEAVIGGSLYQIEQIAESCAREYGRQTDIAVSLEREMFGERHYDTFALPAGEYSSLKIVIDEGRGKNWWCVIFPPLCIEVSCEAGQLKNTDEEEESESALSQLTGEEVELITGEDDKYVVKFKILDFIKKLRGWLKI
jgi:stage II sporulation protein R